MPRRKRCNPSHGGRGPHFPARRIELPHYPFSWPRPVPWLRHRRIRHRSPALGASALRRVGSARAGIDRGGGHMSGTNADILRAVADAFNARDFSTADELLSDDLVFVDVAAGVTTNGRDAFIGY